MKRILFRGKRADNGEWVYGSLMIGFTGITYIIVMHDHILSMTEMYEVNSETVGQLHNGLSEKARQDIYIGDIISCDFYGDEISDPEFESLQEIDNIECDYNFYSNVMLIGNIHDCNTYDTNKENTK